MAHTLYHLVVVSIIGKQKYLNSSADVKPLLIVLLLFAHS
jgi:hypothetical protein